MKNPIFVALDVDSDTEAMRIADLTAPYVGGFKVGPRLALRYGMSLFPQLAKRAPLFIDNKYFDIPSTMEAAVRASFDMGASFTTVHAQAGAEALMQLAKVEKSLNEKRPFRLLAVTVLTSFDSGGLPSVIKPKPMPELVIELAALAIQSGVSGLVCSPSEVAMLRQQFPKAFLLVPGIRMEGAAVGDQKRTADPLSAIKGGASALVVGRPICQAEDPAQAAKAYANAIAGSAK